MRLPKLLTTKYCTPNKRDFKLFLADTRQDLQDSLAKNVEIIGFLSKLPQNHRISSSLCTGYWGRLWLEGVAGERKGGNFAGMRAVCVGCYRTGQKYTQKYTGQAKRVKMVEICI